MPELALHGGEIPGVAHDAFAHGVMRGMGRLAGEAGGFGHVVPDMIETEHAQAAVTLSVGRCGEKQRGRRPYRLVLGTLVFEILSDGR